MKHKLHKQLNKELIEAGALEPELTELLAIADNLTRLKDELSQTANTSLGQKRQTVYAKVFNPAVIALAAICICISLLLFSQSVLPTSWLYPVQRLSDKLAIAVHPQHKETVMMRRARQVNELVTAHAKSKVVLATLADYNTQAAGYKSMSHTDYAAFEYCKYSLQKAAIIAPKEVRQAIINSLKSLQNT